MLKFSLVILFSILTLQKSIAQDVFEIKFTVKLTQYRVALVLFDDGTGKMRVRYYDGGTKMIEQSARIEDTQDGMRVAGYNPVYPGTDTRYPSYIPDNFYIAIDDYGNISVYNIYSGGKARANIKKIENGINTFLSDFNWKL